MPCGFARVSGSCCFVWSDGSYLVLVLHLAVSIRFLFLAGMQSHILCGGCGLLLYYSQVRLGLVLCGSVWELWYICVLCQLKAQCLMRSIINS